MPKLTAQYNEYGYVIRKNSRVIYAAGNGAQGSQDYIGIHERTLQKESIPEDASVFPLWKIEKFCEGMIREISSRPELHNLKGEYQAGEVLYSKDLNPLEEAYKCGALAR